jgi:hypothetical protein
MKPVFLVKPKVKHGTEIKMKINIPKDHEPGLKLDDIQSVIQASHQCVYICQYIRTLISSLLGELPFAQGLSSSTRYVDHYKKYRKFTRLFCSGTSSQRPQSTRIYSLMVDTIKYLYENVSKCGFFSECRG